MKSNNLLAMDDPQKIALKSGGFALVSASDFSRVIEFDWRIVRAKEKQYVARNIQENGKSRRQYMHRFLLGVDGSRTPFVDHKDGDGTNNTRGNIRLCTPQQNACNRESRKGRSKYKGVSPLRVGWEAKIAFGRERFFLGVFETEIEAAFAYNDAATLLHGAFRKLNKIDNTEAIKVLSEKLLRLRSECDSIERRLKCLG